MGVKTKTTEWFKQKVKEYHGDKVEVLSEYLGSEKPIKILYHCEKHGDTEKTINAKNVCKPFFCRVNNVKVKIKVNQQQEEKIIHQSIIMRG